MPDALVGRGVEVELLSGLVAGLVAGQGGVALLEGEPGIGKTTLLEACLAAAVKSGCIVARAVGDELIRRFPLRVLLDALEIDVRSADPRRSAVAEQLRGGPSGRLVATGDPVAAAAEGLLALTERLCAEAPLVLAIDDLQWVDEASLALWRRLAQLTGQVPLLLLGACRPIPQRDEVDAVRETSRAIGHAITLTRLSPGEIVQVLARLINARPDANLQSLVGRAAGNPLWLREITDALTRDRAITIDAGTAALAHADYQIPASLLGAVARRLTFLSQPVVEVLRAAALLGTEFSVVDVATVLAREPSDLLFAVEEAMTAGVVCEAGDRLAFRHPLIRQAMYEQTPGPLRAGLHRYAAQALAERGASVDSVAAQLAATTDVDDWQVEWLARNAPTLINQSLEVGIDLLRRAVEFTGHGAGGTRGEEVAAVLARALFRFSRLEEAQVRAREVLAQTSDPDRAAEMREILTDLLSRGSDTEEAVAIAREGLETEGLSPAWRARLVAQLAAALITRGNLDAPEENARRASDLGAAAGDRYAVGSGLLWLAGVSAFRGDLVAMIDYIDRGLAAIGDDPDCMRIRLLLLYNRVFALNLLDRTADIDEALRAARDLAEAMGGATVQRAYSLVALHAFTVGRWDDAVAELDAVVESTAPDLALIARGIAALIAGHRDEREAAAAELNLIADTAIANAGLRNLSGYALAARALAAEQSDGHASALRILAVLSQPEFAVMDNRHLFFPDVVRLALAVGDHQAAQDAIGAVEADEAQAPIPGLRAAAGRCRGLLAGDAAPVLAAAEHYRSCGRLPELARTLEDAAVVLAAAGDLESARTAAQEAAEIYNDLGAIWDLRRADARLRPYGVRRGARGPRGRPSHGWEALSPTELTVARLVTTGKSNPDIAADLLLSRRTVQSHVSHILVKLGARSRVEIARRATEHSSADGGG